MAAGRPVEAVSGTRDGHDLGVRGVRGGSLRAQRADDAGQVDSRGHGYVGIVEPVLAHLAHHRYLATMTGALGHTRSLGRPEELAGTRCSGEP